jgi:hypothetical protein
MGDLELDGSNLSKRHRAQLPLQRFHLNFSRKDSPVKKNSLCLVVELLIYKKIALADQTTHRS